MVRSILVFCTVVFLSACSCDCLKPPDMAETNPGPVSGTKFCIIGDSGFNNEIQNLVAESLRGEGCEYVIHTGDIVYEDQFWQDGGLEDANDGKFKSHFADYYRDLPGMKHMYITLGNHDYEGNPAAWKELASRSGNNWLVFDDYLSDYAVGDICIFAIDLNVQSDASQFFARTANWLQAAKNRRRAACKFSIAFSHYPYWSSDASHRPGRGDAKSRLKNFLEAEVLGSIDVFASGHSHHLANEGTVDETLLLLSGGAGSCRAARPKRNEATVFAKAGYVTLVLAPTAQGRLKGTYEIKVISEFDGAPVRAVTRYWNTIVGRGVR